MTATGGRAVVSDDDTHWRPCRHCHHDGIRRSGRRVRRQADRRDAGEAIVMIEETSTSCQWCARPFQARRSGGSPRRFCCTKCRTMFWSALRRWGDRAIADGILTIADLKNDAVAACTPFQDAESPMPLSDIGAGDTAPGDALRFIVDIERSKVDWLVKFRMIRSDQQDDLLAIMTGLKCLGQPPSISRIA
jgi:hypothetical protein